MEEHGYAPGSTLPPPRTEAPGPRPLRRPVDDRVAFGVASGLGRYLGIDPVLVRIAFVLLAVFGGSGVLLYLIGLVAIPSETAGEAAPSGHASAHAGGTTAAVAIGGVLVVVGCISLVGALVPGLRDLTGPALLLGLGALVIAWGGRR